MGFNSGFKGLNVMDKWK